MSGTPASTMRSRTPARWPDATSPRRNGPTSSATAPTRRRAPTTSGVGPAADVRWSAACDVENDQQDRGEEVVPEDVAGVSWGVVPFLDHRAHVAGRRAEHVDRERDDRGQPEVPVEPSGHEAERG